MELERREMFIVVAPFGTRPHRKHPKSSEVDAREAGTTFTLKSKSGGAAERPYL